MRIRNWLKHIRDIYIFKLLKEETYEEDFRRNFSKKYSGLLNVKEKYMQL